MTTRRQHLNSRGKTLGDILARQELQTGWHLDVDTEHVLWPTYTDGAILPDGVHPRKPDSIDSLDTIIDYLNELKAQYDLHRVDTDYHNAADSTNDVTSADATDLASALTLAIEIKGDFNAHIAAGLGGAHTHTFAATTAAQTVTVTNPTHTHDVTVSGDPETVTSAATAQATTATVNTAAVSGTTGSGGGSGASDFHAPMGDNINTIVSADATDLATLKTLTLELVTNYQRHLFIGALAMDEDI